MAFMLALFVGMSAFTLVACGDDDKDNKDTTPGVTAVKWSGNVGTVPEAVNNVIEISTGEELAGVAQYVNSSENNNEFSYDGITIKLVADLDLDNKNWTPIGSMVAYPGSSGFAGIFDGNNHIIYNLKVVDNTVGTASAGLFGGIAAGGEVKNLTIKGINLTSSHWAGGIVGFAQDNGGRIKITNCHVENGTITSVAELVDEEYDNGDKVGGIAGYIGCVDIENCSVKNLLIKGYRDIGGIVGYANDGASVKNNTVGEYVVVAMDKAHNYKNYSTDEEYDAGSIIGEKTSGVQESGNTGSATIN